MATKILLALMQLPQHVNCDVGTMYVQVSVDVSLACAVSGVPLWRAIL